MLLMTKAHHSNIVSAAWNPFNMILCTQDKPQTKAVFSLQDSSDYQQHTDNFGKVGTKHIFVQKKLIPHLIAKVYVPDNIIMYWNVEYYFSSSSRTCKSGTDFFFFE